VTDELLLELRGLEVELHRPDVRADGSRMNELLHSKFHEIGRSGRSYTKAEVLRELADGSAPGSIEATDFELFEVGYGAALLTYRSAHVDAQGQPSRPTVRASLWTRTTLGWQMRFHQATPIEASEDAGS
jgi:hypothetical protein